MPTQPSFTSMFTGLRGIHTGIVSHSKTENLAEDEPEVVDRLELRMTRWLKDELQGRVDPLELTLSHGLPIYDWIEIAAKQTGLLES